MTDDPVRRFLRARGVADHVVEGGLEGLVASWEAIAAQVEAGYPLTLDDYLNDLDVRQIIEVVLRSMPEPDGPLVNRLRHADARMLSGTVPASRCVWGEGGWTRRRNWWYYIVPRSPGPDLKADLAREGLTGEA